MAKSEEFQIADFANGYRNQSEAYSRTEKALSDMSITKGTKLYDTDCSVRLLNIIKIHQHEFGIECNRELSLGELSKISTSKFLRCRLAGKKTLNELKRLCFFAGVSLLP